MLIFNPVTLAATGNSSIVVPYSLTSAVAFGQLPSQPIANIGILCDVSGGASLTYSVQVSCSNPNINPQSAMTWINHDVLANQTGSLYSYVQFPITALRLTVSVFSSGSVSMSVVQWP